MDCAEILSRVRASPAAAESEPGTPDRAPKEPFALPSLSQPLPPTLARSWAQQPYVNTGLTVVEIGAVAGCGMLSDGAVVAFHRAGATLDWRDPTQNKPISWDDPIVLLSGEGEVLSSFGSDERRWKSPVLSSTHSPAVLRVRLRCSFSTLWRQYACSCR